MINFDHSGPIIACSTGRKENTAIAILRISSPDSLSLINDSLSIDFNRIEDRKAYFCKIIDKSSKSIIDEVLLLSFRAPASYTGENLIELHVHGNQLNINRILKYFCNQYNFQLALPGEFSYRAYKNNKMDLFQLEGLEQFLNAKNTYALTEGLSGLNGELYNSYCQLRESYLNLRSAIELGIDFLDDIGEEKFDQLLKDRTQQFERLLFSLKKRTEVDTGSLFNPSIALIGEPNSGKSTFFNNFLSFDRSIVTNIEGTTRDLVSESIVINNNQFRLIDTAGIRESKDKVEQEGVKRSFTAVKNAFFKIQVINLFNKKTYAVSDVDLLIFTHAQQPSFLEKFKEFYSKNNKIPPFSFSEKSGPIGPVWTKEAGPIEPIDFIKSGPIEPKLLIIDGPIGPDVKSGSIEPYIKSNKFNDIERFIEQKFNIVSKEVGINSDRQKNLILNIFNEWCELSNNNYLLDDITLFSHEFNRLSILLDELLGITTPDNVLNHVFSNFCIGK
jgi:tRNA modification GTPase